MQLRDIVEQVRRNFNASSRWKFYCEVRHPLALFDGNTLRDPSIWNYSAGSIPWLFVVCRRARALVGFRWANVATWMKRAGRSCASCRSEPMTKWRVNSLKWSRTFVPMKLLWPLPNRFRRNNYDTQRLFPPSPSLINWDRSAGYRKNRWNHLKPFEEFVVASCILNILSPSSMEVKWKRKRRKKPLSVSIFQFHHVDIIALLFFPQSPPHLVSISSTISTHPLVLILHTNHPRPVRFSHRRKY